MTFNILYYEEKHFAVSPDEFRGILFISLVITKIINTLITIDVNVCSELYRLHYILSMFIKNCLDILVN